MKGSECESSELSVRYLPPRAVGKTKPVKERLVDFVHPTTV